MHFVIAIRIRDRNVRWHRCFPGSALWRPTCGIVSDQVHEHSRRWLLHQLEVPRIFFEEDRETAGRVVAACHQVQDAICTSSERPCKSFVLDPESTAQA